MIGLAHNFLALGAGLLGIGFLIGFHELGHFLFCKLFKIRTPSFSIGMGPRLFSKTIGDTEFSLSLLPVGGYVEIAGSAEMGQGEQKEAHATDEGSFARRPFWQKFSVMFGGILFNIIFAYMALVAIFYLGVPQSPLLYPRYASATIATIKLESPAQKGGLEAGDVITAIDQHSITSPEQITKIIRERPGQTVLLDVVRTKENKKISVTVGSQEIRPGTAIGFLGIDFSPKVYTLSEAFVQAGDATWYLMKEIGGAFKRIFFKGEISNVGGPLAVIAQTVKGAQMGLKMFLLLLAFISLNLALLNLLPLPIMDGGQIAYYGIEAITGRPLSEKVREYIHYVTWIFLILLVGILSIRDIGGFLGLL